MSDELASLQKELQETKEALATTRELLEFKRKEIARLQSDRRAADDQIDKLLSQVQAVREAVT